MLTHFSHDTSVIIVLKFIHQEVHYTMYQIQKDKDQIMGRLSWQIVMGVKMNFYISIENIYETIRHIHNMYVIL